MTSDEWILFAILGVGLLPILVMGFFYAAAECCEVMREIRRRK